MGDMLHTPLTVRYGKARNNMDVVRRLRLRYNEAPLSIVVHTTGAYYQSSGSNVSAYQVCYTNMAGSTTKKNQEQDQDLYLLGYIR